MMKSLPISKLQKLEPPYPNTDLFNKLNYLYEENGTSMVDMLTESISPIKVLVSKKKTYPTQNIDEIKWLQSHNPDLEVSTIILGNAKGIEQVQIAIYKNYFIKHLSEYDCKDLHGLEKRWQSTGNHRPILNQKQHTEMLRCERSLTRRHAEKLNKTHENNIQVPSNTVSWDALTRDIPEDTSNRAD
ncbi:hypothetical protein L4D20_03670 [Vibrio kyushuensis]|uniref:hypothetical protein n=1 Tax=Vibrio kyushuensis TaxID=2910249 RepID=UPI003D0A360C